MLKLDKPLTLDREAVKAPDLTDRFNEADLQRIGNEVWEGYNRDKSSRAPWERRSEAALDLAMQLQRDKNFPWPDCANIAFPLVTIAALQFHSRAYSAVIDGKDLVKYQVNGEDPTGELSARGERISTHMSWQLLEEDQTWEEQHDRLLIQLPILGTAFKKSYYDASKKRNCSELVMARDLVVNYWAKSLEECPRKTHIVPLYRNDIRERVMRGTYRNVLEEAWYIQTPVAEQNSQTAARDKRIGMDPPQTDSTTYFTGLEQHVNLDLDDDGYAEPYIVTIEATSKTVLRLVTGFDRWEDIERTPAGKIIKIRAMQYFTKYSFIPSPDGGIYDVGFGILLGPLNESVNTTINQLIDAGTMSTTAGGFLGRGAKIRGGSYRFQPFQWNRVDSTGEDLHKSIFPLPVREPSAVLFQLLVLLINYVNRVAGSTDVMVGENPGQNQPAETTRTVVDQGLKIYGAIFKRVWRAMKEEFKKIYILNGIYLPFSSTYSGGQKALKEDYLGDPDAVQPSADPNVTSDQMQFNQAVALKQAAMSTPGYNPVEVERRFLKALKIPGIDQVYPGPEKMPPGKSEKLQIAEMKLQSEMARIQAEQQQFIMGLMEEQKLNNAEIIKIQADAIKAIADIEGDEKDRRINAVNTQIGLLKARNDAITGQIDRLLKVVELTIDAGKEKESGEGKGSADGRRLLELVGAPGNAGATLGGFTGTGG